MKALLPLLLFFIIQAAVAQCPFNPVVTGDTMMCPGQNGFLITQSYDSYQWYKRGFSDTVAQLIVGADSQSLAINQFDDAGFYFFVEATQNGCTERSPELLVDGWAFLPLTVQTTGDFNTGTNGEFILCEGDTAFFSLMLPYDISIVWYKNNSAIPGASMNVLMVTDSGIYSVSGAPAVCPDFVQQLGVPLVVEVINCGTGISEGDVAAFECYWNYADDAIYIQSLGDFNRSLGVQIFSTDGKLFLSEKAGGADMQLRINTASIPAGMYICTITSERSVFSKKLVLSK